MNGLAWPDAVPESSVHFVGVACRTFVLSAPRLRFHGRFGNGMSGERALFSVFLSAPILRCPPKPMQRWCQRFSYCVLPNRMSLALSSVIARRLSASTVTPRCTAGRDGGGRMDGVEPALHAGKVAQFQALIFPRARPWKAGDVGDGVLVAGEVGRFGQLPVEHAIQALGFVGVAVDGVIHFFRCVDAEMMRLTEHRAETAHL